MRRYLGFAWMDIIRGQVAEAYECDLCQGRGRFSVCWGRDGEGLFTSEPCHICQQTGAVSGATALRRLMFQFGDQHWIRALRMADGEDCGPGIGNTIFDGYVKEAVRMGVITHRPDAPAPTSSYVRPVLGWTPTTAGTRVLALLRDHGR